MFSAVFAVIYWAVLRSITSAAVSGLYLVSGAAKAWTSSALRRLDAKNTYKDNPLTAKYEEKAKNLLKGELKRRAITYAQLVEKLAEIGATETEQNLRNKISRGGFTAAFLIQCLEAIGCQSLRLSD